MARVKMNAKHEYEFIANFKILQNVFKAKKIDKVRHPSSTPSSKSNCPNDSLYPSRSLSNARCSTCHPFPPPLPLLHLSLLFKSCKIDVSFSS